MTISLRQTTATNQRIDVRQLRPSNLLAMSKPEIRRMPLFVGNRQTALGELFHLDVSDDDKVLLNLYPANDRLDYLGSGLQLGEIIVHGDVGNHVGHNMSGGRIEIRGNAGDHAGGGMRSGELDIQGNVGDYTGGPASGERRGQQGGLIRIRGNAGNRAGERMRRGKLLIEGDCGECLGHRMIAGTIYAAGQVGALAGLGMRRGTLLLHGEPSSTGPTFADNGVYQLPFLRLLLNDINRLLQPDQDRFGDPQSARRLVGDLSRDGRGEILILS
jgi:formylmethanofuran dehydrogenase subunit C